MSLSCPIQRFKLEETWSHLEHALSLAKQATEHLSFLLQLGFIQRTISGILLRVREELDTWGKRVPQQILLFLLSWEDPRWIRRLARVCHYWNETLAKLRPPPHVLAMPISFHWRSDSLEDRASGIRNAFIYREAYMHSHQDHYHSLRYGTLYTYDLRGKSDDSRQVTLPGVNFALIDSPSCILVVNRYDQQIQMPKKTLACLPKIPSCLFSKIERPGTKLTDARLLGATHIPEPHVIYNDDDLVFVNLITGQQTTRFSGKWVGLDVCDNLVFAMEYKTESFSTRILLHIFSPIGVPLAVYCLGEVLAATHSREWSAFETYLHTRWLCVHMSNHTVYHVHLYCDDASLGGYGRLLVEKQASCPKKLKRVTSL